MKELLARYLELDKVRDDGPTLKVLADNLRSYPVIVVFWLAVSYLWVTGGPVGVIVSILWGAWLLFISILIAFQSAVLVLAVIADLTGHKPTKAPNPPSIASVAIAMLAVMFLFSSAVLAIGVFHAIKG